MRNSCMRRHRLEGPFRAPAAVALRHDNGRADDTYMVGSCDLLPLPPRKVWNDAEVCCQPAEHTAVLCGLLTGGCEVLPLEPSDIERELSLQVTPDPMRQVQVRTAAVNAAKRWGNRAANASVERANNGANSPLREMQVPV